MKHLAIRILHELTEAMMTSVEYHPENNRALYELMTEECACTITNKLIEGELTPMEYNDVRNELAELLWKIFASHLKYE